MATVLDPAAFPSSPPFGPLVRFTVDEYDQMVASGLIEESRRCELIEGLLVEKMPKDWSHSATLLRLRKLFEAFTSVSETRYFVATEIAIRIERIQSQPEPDLSVVKGCIEDYVETPTSDDVLFVFEVANTSLRKDRQMAGLYAAAGVERYVLVDVNGQTLTLHEQPSVDGYRSVQTVERVPVVIDGETVGELSRDDLFPNGHPNG